MSVGFAAAPSSGQAVQKSTTLMQTLSGAAARCSASLEQMPQRMALRALQPRDFRLCRQVYAVVSREGSDAASAAQVTREVVEDMASANGNLATLFRGMRLQGVLVELSREEGEEMVRGERHNQNAAKMAQSPLRDSRVALDLFGMPYEAPTQTPRPVPEAQPGVPNGATLFVQLPGRETVYDMQLAPVGELTRSPQEQLKPAGLGYHPNAERYLLFVPTGEKQRPLLNALLASALVVPEQAGGSANHFGAGPLAGLM